MSQSEGEFYTATHRCVHQACKADLCGQDGMRCQTPDKCVQSESDVRFMSAGFWIGLALAVVAFGYLAATGQLPVA